MRGETRFLTFRLPNIIGQCVELCTPTVELHGLLHESYAHERLKSSLAFRKPATYADSRHPARTEGL